jgi:hypothetical protein
VVQEAIPLSVWEGFVAFLQSVPFAACAPDEEAAVRLGEAAAVREALAPAGYWRRPRKRPSADDHAGHDKVQRRDAEGVLGWPAAQ